MAPSTSSVRLVGGPPASDGLVLPAAVAEGGAVLLAVRGSRWCALAELRQECADRDAAEQLAGAWLVARYEIWGRPRRLRPQLYRHTGSYELAAVRGASGRWTLEPGVRSRPAASPTPGPAARSDPGATGAITTGQSGAADAARAATDPARTVWDQLEDEVDQAANRFRQVADLLPDGPLADRAQGAVRAGDACVADATRLCAVGLTVAAGWRPGSPDDEATSLVARIGSLIGTIDEATRELVRLHLELGDPEPPAEALAILAASVAELEAATRDPLGLEPPPAMPLQAGPPPPEPPAPS
jgi:hypothetical protein